MSGRYDLSQRAAPADNDPRAMIALARVNWLHSKYKIVSSGVMRLASSDLKRCVALQTNDEMIYSLGLFIHEPAVRLMDSSERLPGPKYIYLTELG